MSANKSNGKSRDSFNRRRRMYSIIIVVFSVIVILSMFLSMVSQ